MFWLLNMANVNKFFCEFKHNISDIILYFSHVCLICIQTFTGSLHFLHEGAL